MICRSMAWLTEARGNCTAPPSPARKAPRMKTPVNRRLCRTPSAATISRSCVAARTRTPQRVRRNSRPKASSTATPERDQHQVVDRIARAEDADGALQPRRARSLQVLRPPDQDHQVLDDQHHAEGGEQLEQLGRAVDAAQDGGLDQRAEQRHRRRRQHQREPEAAGHGSADAARPACRRRRRPACRTSRGRS